MQRRRAGPLRMRSKSVPSLPAMESESRKASASGRELHRGQQLHDAERRGAVAAASPEPSTSRGARAEPSGETGWQSGRLAPSCPRRRPGSARSLSSISAKKLSDGLFVSSDQPRHRRRVDARQHGRLGRGHAGARLQPHPDAARLERGVEACGGERRRIRLEAAAALGEQAAVVGEAAERADPDRHAVAGVRAAAERVERRLVAVDPAGDPLDAGLLERAGELLDGGAAAVGALGEAAAAEGGVAAAAQVEVAAPDALGVELPCRAPRCRECPRSRSGRARQWW